MKSLQRRSKKIELTGKHQVKRCKSLPGYRLYNVESSTNEKKSALTRSCRYPSTWKWPGGWRIKSWRKNFKSCWKRQRRISSRSFTAQRSIIKGAARCLITTPTSAEVCKMRRQLHGGGCHMPKQNEREGYKVEVDCSQGQTWTYWGHNLVPRLGCPRPRSQSNRKLNLARRRSIQHRFRKRSRWPQPRNRNKATIVHCNPRVARN